MFKLKICADLEAGDQTPHPSLVQVTMLVLVLHLPASKSHSACEISVSESSWLHT